jgi:hypothetical protein
MDAFVTGPWHHYIIVEKSDLRLFLPLKSSRRTILTKEEVMPRWLHHLISLPMIPQLNFWWSWKTGFMVGWHVQQLIKMQMAFVINDDGMAICDSDMFFVRPFDVSNLSKNGKLRFYRTEESFSEAEIANPSFVKSASRQLSLPEKAFPARIYVDQFVTWHAPTVREICTYIEKVSGKDWRAALGRHVIISEYTIYGLYVERLAKQAEFAGTSEHLCKTVWDKQELRKQSLEEFVETVAPPDVSVCFQSFLGVDVAELRRIFLKAVAGHAKPAMVS